MLKSSVWGEGSTKKNNRWPLSFSLLFPVLLTIIALLIGISLGLFAPYAWAFAIGMLAIAVIITLRQDQLAATFVIVIHLYVDWYLGLLVVAPILAFALLVIYFLGRSPQHPWIQPRALWLWIPFLVLAINPAIQGALTRYDAAFYYPNIVFGALLMFWLGTIIARDLSSLRRFFKLLAGVGTFLAVLTIIQFTTGTLWFGSSRFDQELATTANFALTAGSSVARAGAFFVNPDWNGTFFATMLFLPLGLFTESSSVLKKILYLAEVLLILLALLFTYSTGAWVGALGSLGIFILLVGHTRYRILLALLVCVIALAGALLFPAQLDLQLQHALGPNELSVRIGAWQTGISVISAFPLTGIGLGLQAYLQRAEPYRVPAQLIPLVHPHNSFIEIGAMAGLPVLAVFIVLLSFGLWQALHNRVLFDKKMRPLFGGGIAAVVALSFNSLSINGWTLPPLAAIGWIILGSVSSTLLAKKQVAKGHKSV